MAFMAAALPLLSTIGTIASVGGSVASGLYGASVASNNAQQAKLNAQYAHEAGSIAASDESLKGAAKAAKIKTGYAASGIDVASGSAQSVLASERAVTDVDIDRIFHNADMSAYGYTTQQKNFENEAGMKMLEGVTGAVGSFAEKAPSLSWKWAGNNAVAAGTSVVG